MRQPAASRTLEPDALPLRFPLASANEALAAFEPQFKAARNAGLRRKLGLFTERDGDARLAEDLLERTIFRGRDLLGGRQIAVKVRSWKPSRLSQLSSSGGF
jgi:hypothetical protein